MKLCNTLYCLLILTLSIKTSTAEKNPNIAEIRKWYNQIEGNKKLKAKTFTSGKDDLPQTVKLTRYESSDGKLQKIYLEGGGEHGQTRTSYYYKNGRLFFVYEATNEWRFTGKKLPSGEDEAMDIASEYRLYFKNNACIKALGKKVELVGGDELNALLKAKKNEEFKVVAAMNSYLKSAAELAKIKSTKSLLKHFFEN